MTTFVLIVMALSLMAALERTNRRHAPHAPGLYGANDHNDRDWARTQLDLLARAGEAEPFAFKTLAVKRPARTDAPVLQHTTKPARREWNTSRHDGPRAA